jgi:hypothetical protein
MRFGELGRWVRDHNRCWVGSTAPGVLCAARGSGPRDSATASAGHIDTNLRRSRIGELLQDAGVVGTEELAAAALTGGRLPCSTTLDMSRLPIAIPSSTDDKPVAAALPVRV